MGVHLDGAVPADPSGPNSWLDTILSGAEGLGAGLAEGFAGLLNGIGQILAGAVDAVGAVFNGIVNGVIGLVSGIANAIGRVFTGSGGNPSPPPPPEPIFNPIKTNLEAALAPKFATIDEALNGSGGLSERLSELNDELGDLIDPANPDSRLWEIQEQINDLSRERDDLQDIAIKALEEAQAATVRVIPRTLFVPRDTPVSDDYISVTRVSNGHRWRVTAKGLWVGHYIWQSAYYFDSAAASPVLDGRNVGQTPTRVWDEYAWNRNASVLTYHVWPGTPESQIVTHPQRTLPSGSWTQVWDFTAIDEATHTLYFRGYWPAANYLDTFGIRIMRTRGGNTAELWRIGPRNRVGPLIGDGGRNMTITIQNSPLLPGDILSFQAYVNASNSVNRQWRGETRISWIAPPDPDDLPIQT